jgi:hypothetical protein
MDKWNQQLIDVLTRSRPGQSKAAAMQQPEMITICKKEYEDLKDTKCANIIRETVMRSKAASLTTGITKHKSFTILSLADVE